MNRQHRWVRQGLVAAGAVLALAGCPNGTVNPPPSSGGGGAGGSSSSSTTTASSSGAGPCVLDQSKIDNCTLQ
jgi:hypothetical protein